MRKYALKGGGALCGFLTADMLYIICYKHKKTPASTIHTPGG